MGLAAFSLAFIDYLVTKIIIYEKDCFIITGIVVILLCRRCTNE